MSDTNDTTPTEPSTEKTSAPRRGKPADTGAPVVEHTGGAWSQVRDYMERTRDLPTSLLLVLPLVILYQLGVIALGGVQNGVDFVTGLMWAASGKNFGGYVLINLVLFAIFAGVTFYLRKRGSFSPKLWPAVIAESTLYAMFFGGAVVWSMSLFGLDALLAAGAKQGGVFSSFILSLGAGIYEETVFRLAGVGGTFALLSRFVKWPKWALAAIAVIGSSIIFSAIHHIGALGDPFTMGTFLFRFFAGILLALIFYLRGFAVAVYTHAIYDVIVMIFK